MARIRTLPAGKGLCFRQQGFTYLILLAAIVVLGIIAEGASTLQSYETQAEKEKELLFRGKAYIDAIASYYDSGKTLKLFPRTLDDLVKDPRYEHRKHIRRLYRDPVTNGGWEIIRDGQGGIVGVYSRSQKKPRKKAFFPAGLEEFENATSYSDWKFEYKPEIKMPIINSPSST